MKEEEERAELRYGRQGCNERCVWGWLRYDVWSADRIGMRRLAVEWLRCTGYLIRCCSPSQVNYSTEKTSHVVNIRLSASTPWTTANSESFHFRSLKPAKRAGCNHAVNSWSLGFCEYVSRLGLSTNPRAICYPWEWWGYSNSEEMKNHNLWSLGSKNIMRVMLQKLFI